MADEAISAEDSASFLIAQMTAFDIPAENAQHIADAVNEVANQFSVSSGDISNSLGNMSAVMAQTGASFEESLGMLTAITEVTRNSNKASRGKQVPKCIVICTICIHLKPVNPKALILKRDFER